MTDIMTAVSIFLQLFALLTAGIWAVSAIKSTTERLTITIDNLELTVKKIGAAIETIEKKAYDHELRIAMLERLERKEK